MATNFEIVLPFNSNAALAHGETAFNLLDELEDQLTVYRDHSEVCRLNRTAFAAPVPVERGLVRPVVPKRHASRRRRTALLMRRPGRSSKRGASSAGRGACLPKRNVPPLWSAWECNGSSWTRHGTASSYKRPGLEINLGAIGKGYALDRVGDYLVGTGQVSRRLIARRPEQRLCQRSAQRRSARLARGHFASLGERPTPGGSLAARPLFGNLSGHLSTPGIQRKEAGPHSRSTQRLAGRRNRQRVGPRPDGSASRRPFDGLLRRRRRTGAPLLRGPSGGRRLAAARRRRRRAGDPESRPAGMLLSLSAPYENPTCGASNTTAS